MMNLLRREIRRRIGGHTGHRRFLFAAVLSGMGVAGCGVEQLSDQRAEESTVPDSRIVTAEVVEMLHASTASWNQGDLDGFLDDYWRSEDLTFSGGTGVTRGWEGVRARYLRSYWAPGATRDSLRFVDLEVTALGDDHALALGRYVLYRPGEEEVVTNTGHFSLVLRREDGAWKIIHDHTSATPQEEEAEGGA